MSLSFQKLIAFLLCFASVIVSVTLINVLIGCAIAPPITVPLQARDSQIMACLPNAIMLCEGLQEAGIQSKVLSIYTERSGHAVTVYLYPTGKNQMWVWDATWGSVSVIAFYDNPLQIARAWMRKLGDYTPVTSAEFRQ